MRSARNRAPPALCEGSPPLRAVRCSLPRSAARAPPRRTGELHGQVAKPGHSARGSSFFARLRVEGYVGPDRKRRSLPAIVTPRDASSRQGRGKYRTTATGGENGGRFFWGVWPALRYGSRAMGAEIAGGVFCALLLSVTPVLVTGVHASPFPHGNCRWGLLRGSGRGMDSCDKHRNDGGERGA
jgi:hypothetical protein